MNSNLSIFSCSFSSKTSSHALLQRSAGAYSGLPPEKLNIQTAMHGKPFFPQCPDIHFSITHSGVWWLCAFGPQPVGLDLQQHERCDFMSISHRFLHKDENLFLESSGYENFFDLWTAKESYLKYTGQGLTADLSSFSVVSNGQLVNEIGGVTLTRIYFQPGYSLCLCSISPYTVRQIKDW